MKTITLEELLETNDFYLHWSSGEQKEIEEKGCLQASIGENSKAGSETTPKVYFSKGIEGEIGLLNRYLNMILELQEDKSDLNKVYQIFEQELKNKIKGIYKLDLNHTDKKNYEMMSEEEKKEIDFLDDDINEENGQIMTTRNMHTIVGKNIDVSKLTKVDVDMIELIQKFYEEYKDKEEKGKLEVNYLKDGFSKELISGFIRYEKTPKKIINNEFKQKLNSGIGLEEQNKKSKEIQKNQGKQENQNEIQHLK